MIDFDALVLKPCQDVFAWEITLDPKDAPGFTIPGIFSSDFTAVTSTGEMVIQGRAPVLGLRQANFHAIGARFPRQSDRLTIKNPFTGKCFAFEVSSVEPDIEGDLQVHLLRRT